MRILVAHNVTRARTGGMSRMLGFIHDRLAAVGHEVDYFCSDDVPSRLRGRASRLAFPLLLYRHARAAARTGRPYDLINVHEPAGAFVAAFRRPLGRPIVVVTSHGVEQRGWEVALEEQRLGREGPGWKTRMLYPPTLLLQAAIALRQADHVFCLSDEDRVYMTRRMGIAAERITRIYPGADPEYEPLAGARDYAHANRLLFFGSWLSRKGTADLVTAFTALVKRHPSLVLTVLGAGVPAERVEAMFPPAIRRNVAWTEARTEPAIAKVFAASDIYVLPSLFEGTPQTLIETMMSGLPAVCTATCGMRDVVEDGKTGLLVPIRSPDAIVAAVERLIGDADLRARLGRAAHAAVRAKYTWDLVAVPVREAYDVLFRGTAAARADNAA